MVDLNTGKSLLESDAIIQYLYATYGPGEVCWQLRFSGFATATNRLALRFRKENGRNKVGKTGRTTKARPCHVRPGFTNKREREREREKLCGVCSMDRRSLPKFQKSPFTCGGMKARRSQSPSKKLCRNTRFRTSGTRAQGESLWHNLCEEIRTLRWSMFYAVNRGSPKRQGIFERTGRFQVPYLEDPNTGVALFESADIVQYIKETYGA